MKCKLLYERELNVHAGPSQAMLDVAIKKNGGLWLPVGTVIDHPDCHWIVKMGQAEAVDDECRAATGVTPEAHAARLLAGEMLDACIAPDDRPLYIAGYIRGYNADGSFKPGPNWDAYQATLKQPEVDKDEI